MPLINKVSKFKNPGATSAQSYQTEIFKRKTGQSSLVAPNSGLGLGGVIPGATRILPSGGNVPIDANYLVTETSNFLMTENDNNLIT